MAENIGEMLNELYALRAGLSVMSKLKDEADAAKERSAAAQNKREKADEEARTRNRLRETTIAMLKSEEYDYVSPFSFARKRITLDMISSLEEKTKAENDRREKLEQKYTERAANADNALAAYVYDGEVLSSALYEQFTKLLDERDWGNLDLIIYYFETGRAESKKEALQLVDEERRKNEIVSAVNDAGRNIAQSINTGFSRLQNALMRSFNELTRQVGKMSENIASLCSAAERQSEIMDKRLGELNSAIEYGNALREKANVSSAQLVDDMKYMRGLAENAEIRRRNMA